jgi:hypothetical protein
MLFERTRAFAKEDKFGFEARVAAIPGNMY